MKVRLNQRLETIVWSMAVVLGSWSFGFAEVAAGDLWWHLASGRWMLDNGSIPLVDPFSFTALGQRWVYDVWLSDLVLALWAKRLGLDSLVWWKWATIALTHLILFWVLARKMRGHHPAAFLATLFAAAVGAPFLDLRPQLLTFLCFSLLLLMAEAGGRALWALVPLLLLWANLHAGFVFALLALPILLAPRWWRDPPGERARLLTVAAVSYAACALNPNGLEVFFRPFRYAFDTSSPFRGIAEWRPAFAQGGIHSWLYPVAIAYFATYALYFLLRAPKRGWKEVPWAEMGLGVLTLLMSLRSRRFVPLFAISQTLVLAPGLAFSLAPVRRRLGGLALACLALVFTGWLLWRQPVSSESFSTLVAEGSFPVDALDFMDARDLSGNVLAFYQWGGYVLFRASDRFRVFIDGRAGTVYDEETFRSYLRILDQAPGWTDLVQESKADFVLWPSSRPSLPAALASTGLWLPRYSDARAILLARVDRTDPSLQP